MRALIYLLVFGNLLVFALAGGWIGGSSPGSPAAAEALSPDRIRIVSRGDPPAVVSVAAAPVTVPAPLACIEWPDISRSQAEQVIAASEGSGIAASRQLVVAETKQWWVGIPPSPNGKIGAEKKRAELRRLGVKDVSIILEEGSNRYALSFGVFSSEAEADAVVGKLRQKNVRSAQKSSFFSSEARERVVLQGLGEKLVTLRATLSGLVAVSCDATGKAATNVTDMPGRQETGGIVQGGGSGSSASVPGAGPAPEQPAVAHAEGRSAKP